LAGVCGQFRGGAFSLTHWLIRKHAADDPRYRVAVGTRLALEHMDMLRDSLEEP
jgi:hypothetical protein